MHLDEQATDVGRVPVTRPTDDAPEGGRHGGDGFEDDFPGLAALAYRVAYRILGSKAEAEDVSQEALARAFLRWRHVRGYAEPWVARVAGNLAIDRVRARRPLPGATVRCDGDSHDRALDRMVLDELLRTLPRRQRQVLVLRYLADQSEANTARALGCSVGAVKRHAHRALTTLRALAPDEPPGGDRDVRPSR